MMNFKGFLTNLGKYNEGNLVGKWIEFPIDDKQFQIELKNIGIDGVRYEEYFFTDWYYKGSCPVLEFGEYESIDYLNKIAEALGRGYDSQVFAAIAEYFTIDDALITLQDGEGFDDFILYRDAFNDEDLGYALVDEAYDLSKIGKLAQYFDYESYGRDYRLNTNGGFTQYGFIEQAI